MNKNWMKMRLFLKVAEEYLEQNEYNEELEIFLVRIWSK